MRSRGCFVIPGMCQVSRLFHAAFACRGNVMFHDVPLRALCIATQEFEVLRRSKILGKIEEEGAEK